MTIYQKAKRGNCFTTLECVLLCVLLWRPLTGRILVGLRGRQLRSIKCYSTHLQSLSDFRCFRDEIHRCRGEGCDWRRGHSREHVAVDLTYYIQNKNQSTGCLFDRRMSFLPHQGPSVGWRTDLLLLQRGIATYRQLNTRSSHDWAARCTSRSDDHHICIARWQTTMAALLTARIHCNDDLPRRDPRNWEAIVFHLEVNLQCTPRPRWSFQAICRILNMFAACGYNWRLNTHRNVQ